LHDTAPHRYTPSPPPPGGKVDMIIDTDLSIDVDDVGKYVL
jgi:hypothetical protein